MNQPDIDAAPLAWAFYFAGQGRRILPIPARAKRPVLKEWQNLATTDPDQLAQLFAAQPNANYGLLMGDGAIAVDIDPRHGGHLWLEVNEHRLPETWKFKTGGGGVHLVYRTPDGQDLGNRTSIAQGVDIKGKGGQIVGPGSIHPSGARYTIEFGPEHVDMAPAPPWLVELILPPRPAPQRQPKPLAGDVDRYCAAAIADELRRLGQADKGTRNDTLNKAAFAIGGFVRAGTVPEDWARVVLESRAVSIGLSARESRSTIASAFAAAQPREVPS